MPWGRGLGRVLDRTRPGWRERRRHRRSLWHLPKVIVFLGGWAALAYGGFRLAWALHVVLVPEHAGRLGEFWPEGIGFRALVPSLMLVFGPAVATLGPAGLMTNLILWTIPPARRAFQAEARNRRDLSFAHQVRDLTRATVRYLGPVGIGLALLGAATLRNLR